MSGDGVRRRLDRDRLDHDVLHRAIGRAVAAVLVALDGGDRVGDLHARDHAPEDGVLGVEVRRVADHDEELGAAGVGPRVRHRHGAAAVVQSADLVGDLVAGAALAVVARVAILRERIAGLDHEAGNHAVEEDPLVELLVRELHEVRDRLRRDVGAQRDADLAHVAHAQHGDRLGVDGRFGRLRGGCGGLLLATAREQRDDAEREPGASPHGFAIHECTRLATRSGCVTGSM